MFGVGPQEAHFEMNTYDIYKKQLTIQGSFINPLTFRDAISLVSAGKMNIGGLISHELGLDEVQTAAMPPAVRGAGKGAGTAVCEHSYDCETIFPTSVKVG